MNWSIQLRAKLQHGRRIEVLPAAVGQLNCMNRRYEPQLHLVAAAEQSEVCSRAKDDGLIGIAEESAVAAS